MQKSIVLILFLLLASACSPQSAPTGTCEITPHGGVIAYELPSAASDEFGILSETYAATAKTADGFYGFDPGVAQAGNSGPYRLRWVLKTHNLTTSPGCANIPTVVGPIAGLCYAMLGMDTPVYSSADASSSILTTLLRNDYVMVTGSEPNWFIVDLNVGTANMDAIGYLEESNIGGLKGTCDGF